MDKGIKRKLKYMYERMPKDKISSNEIITQIHKKTGFPRYQIKEVIDEYFDSVEQAIIDKKSISLPKLGTIFSAIKPGKNVVKINKFSDKDAELMFMPARWTCRFKVKPSFAKKLLEKEPTKEEVDNIYKD